MTFVDSGFAIAGGVPDFIFVQKLEFRARLMRDFRVKLMKRTGIAHTQHRPENAPVGFDAWLALPCTSASHTRSLSFTAPGVNLHQYRAWEGIYTWATN